MNQKVDPGAVYQKLIGTDRHPPPPDIAQRSGVDLGLGGTDRTIYTSPEYHRRELARMWPRVWQLACREEHIPQPGDVFVYDIVDWSFLVVRQADRSIKAFYNSCTHRGLKLCDRSKRVKQFRCPFHAFVFDIDGRLAQVPTPWDFPHVSNETHRLPEVNLATWGGFVFINMDPQAMPLEEYLEDIPAQFATSRFEDLYVAGHYLKLLPSNWKASIEAFIESLHSNETHSQTVGFAGDTDAQYDVLPGRRHTSRFLQPIGIPSATVSPRPSEQQVVDRLFTIIMESPNYAPKLPEGMTARQFLADMTRQQLEQQGRDVSMFSDAELLDAMQYSLFPNVVLFRGIGFPVVYRFRPNGHDPDSSLMELIILKPVPKGAPRPAPAKVVEMGEMRYRDIPELPKWLGDIYDQDVGNLRMQQLGFKVGTMPLVLSQYQEIRIRHLQQTLREYLSDP